MIALNTWRTQALANGRTTSRRFKKLRTFGRSGIHERLEGRKERDKSTIGGDEEQGLLLPDGFKSFDTT
jgi:hypothetical protein